MDNIKRHLEEILSDKRYQHSLQVAHTAVQLAKRYQIDPRKAEIAGLLHDCGKNISLDRMKQLLRINKQTLPKEYFSGALLHGFAGSIYARNVFKIEDKSILDAIKYHTVGRKNMSMLEKIIYISDVIEPSRKGKVIDKLRKMVYENIDDAILYEVEDKIKFLIKNKIIIHTNTVELRNMLIYKRNLKGCDQMALIEVPKAELHLHLDGSLRAETVIKIAKELKVELPTYVSNELKKYLCVNSADKTLIDYLKKFEIPLKIMQTQNALEQISYEILEDLYKDGYIYAEIRFAPHLHQYLGLSLEQIVSSVLAGKDKAEKKYSIRSGIILCIMRHMDKRYGYDIVELAKAYKNKGVVGIDLAGDEANYSIDIFKDVFDKARKNNINITIHAGEARGWESVDKAIKYGAKRIGHGIRAFENEKLVEIIAKERILLEICPTSNIQTKVLKDMSKYPIKYFLEKGVELSLNTDNKMVSNTNLENEALVLNKKYDITKEEINKMVENNIKYSFGGK